MLKTTLASNTIEDLARLVREQVIEGLRLDYKSELEDGKTDDVVQDIVAFANVAGGDIVVGMPEARGEGGEKLGYPSGHPGIVAVFNEFKERVENALRDSTEPRVRGVQFHPIEVDDGRVVIIIRVAKSWSGPHSVRRGDKYRFASRNSVGTFSMNWPQIKEAFLGANSITREMAEFRTERIGKILAGETPIPVRPGGKLAIHWMPVDGGVSVETLYANGSHFQPPFHQATGGFFNFDGWLSLERWADSNSDDLRPANSYIQSFRNGAFEAIQALPMFLNFGIDANDSRKEFAYCIDWYILRFIDNYQHMSRVIGLNTPVFVGLTFIDVRGFRLGLWPNQFPEPRTRCEIDREVLPFPEIELERFDYSIEELAILFRGALDMLWQALGVKACTSFDKETGDFLFAENVIGLRGR